MFLNLKFCFRLVKLYNIHMNNEQINLNENRSEEIKNNEGAQEVAPTRAPINVEDEQAKSEARKQKEEANNIQIEEQREKIMKQFDGVNQEKVLDPFGAWKEKEVQKIENKAKEMEGQVKSGAISDRGPVPSYDKNFALEALNNYGELKFVDFAIKEGNQDDVKYALKLVDTYYRDRDDLKATLMEKSNQK